MTPDLQPWWFVCGFTFTLTMFQNNQKMELLSPVHDEPEVVVAELAGVIYALALLITAVTGLLALVANLKKQVNRLEKNMAQSVNGIVDDRVKAAKAEGHAEGKAEGIIKGIEKSWREGGSAKKVLIVDDQPDVVSLFTILLESAGYLVFSAKDGLEALKKVQAVRPDLILLDWRMPGMDGAAALVWIKEVSSAPVMVVTGYPEDKLPLSEVAAVLPKPVEPKTLLTKVGQFFKDK